MERSDKSKMIKDAQQLTEEDKRSSYRRGSVIDRWRRASMFDMLVQDQVSRTSSKSDASRISQIQGTKSMGLSRDHRARMIAFEMAAEQIRHSENEGSEEDSEWIGLNPYCV